MTNSPDGCSAGSDGLRTFDTTGTVFRRVGNVLTITCDNGEVATRVADQLRTPAQAAGMRVALDAFVKAYGAQESSTKGLDDAYAAAKAALFCVRGQ